MGGKRAAEIGGFLELEAPLSWNKSKVSSKRNLKNECAVEKTTTTFYKDEFSGCSTQFAKKHRVTDFVDKSTGRLASKEEVTYKSTLKIDNQFDQGCFNEFQTQVKFKKVAVPAKNTAKCTKKYVKFTS